MWQYGVWHFLFEAIGKVGAYIGDAGLPQSTVVHVAGEINSWVLKVSLV